MRASLRVCLTSSIIAASFGCATSNNHAHETPAAGLTVPTTDKRPVSDEYHGTSVTEDYRWLENWEDPAVKSWSDAQNAYARNVLDKLPNVDLIRARVTEILSSTAVSYWSLSHEGGKLFAKKRQPPKQQPFLVVMESADKPDSERILVDPGAMDETGSTAIDWYIASPDGKLVAVSLSKGGTESGDVHVYDVATGKQIHEVVPGVNGGTAGGDLAWATDSSGFFYTRYPRGKERPAEDMNFYMQLYFHKLGTPTEKDRYEIGKDFPRIAEIQLEMHHKSGLLLATVQKGDGGEFSHHLRLKNGSWKTFSTFGDRTVQAIFGPRDDLYVVSRKDAPKGRILRIPIKKLDVTKGEVVVEQSDDNIVTDFWGKPTILPTESRLYVNYQLGGPSEIRVFDLDGNPKDSPKQLPVSSAGSITPVGGDDIIFSNMSFVQAPGWYHFSPKTGETRKTGLYTKSLVDLSGYEVVRELATSKDGTKVPVNIIHKKGLKLDGSHPCLVYGYGGYGVSLEPWFRSRAAVFLEQGVVYALANIRGGGEYGEEWHLQGNLANKQNVFDDFKAAIDLMVTKKYTTNQRLAIMGGSNGGLLMGALMTQHPDAAKTVISTVGIYDMLRVELSPNGAFNVTEFGTVKNKDHFEAMLAYSPYHNVQDGAAYPPTLFLTGANDPRVDPMQSRKMTARLQAASVSDGPILLRTSANSGHGGDTALSERIEQYVDIFSFLFYHLEVDYEPVNADQPSANAAQPQQPGQSSGG